MELTLWIEQRGSAAVAENVHGALVTIDRLNPQPKAARQMRLQTRTDSPGSIAAFVAPRIRSMQPRWRLAEGLALILVNSSEQRFRFEAQLLHFSRRLRLLRFVVPA